MSANKTSEQSFGYCDGATLTTGEFISRLEEYSEKAKELLDAAKAKLNALTGAELEKFQADFNEKNKMYEEAVLAANQAKSELR